MRRQKSILLIIILITILIGSIGIFLVVQGFPQTHPDSSGIEQDAPEDTPAQQPTSTITPSITPSLTPTITLTPTPTHTPTMAMLPRLNNEYLPFVELSAPSISGRQNQRPELSGNAILVDTEHFRIHYTRTGFDAVIDDDIDGNKIPDYVEETANVMEYIWFNSFYYFNWPEPPADNGLGGNDKYDIYLINIAADGDALGYCSGDEDNEVKDNPKTDVVEKHSYHSFIVLDSDYAEVDSIWSDAFDNLYSTAAHEYMHAIQYGIDGSEPYSWLWEASATWYEDEMFDYINDTIWHSYSVFKSPDTCMLDRGGKERDADDLHWYGLWIFIRYISEQYTHEAVRSIWEDSINLSGYSAFSHTFESLGTTLEDAYVDYAIALLTKDFDEGHRYPTLKLEGEASAGETFIPSDGVGQFASEYVQINGSGTVSVQLISPELTAFLVGINDSEADVYPFEEQKASIDLNRYNFVYVVIVNLNKANSESDCEFYAYTLKVTDGGELVEPAWKTNADQFKPPEIEN